MIKKVRGSLTVRICLMMGILLLLASGITYAAVAKFLPVFYSSRLDENLDELSRELAENLSSYQSIEEASATLQLFTASTEMPVAVLDQSGDLVWPLRSEVEMSIRSEAKQVQDTYETTDDVSETEIVMEAPEAEEGAETTEIEVSVEAGVKADEIGVTSEGETIEITQILGDEAEQMPAAEAELWSGVIMQFLDGDAVISDYAWDNAVSYEQVSDAEVAGFAGRDSSAIKSYDLKLGATPYVMLVAGDMQAVNQATEILHQIFPYILGLAVVMAGVFAGAGAIYLTAPIVRLSRISRKMAALDFSDQYRGKRKDELGELGRNLNEMAHNLSGTLENLSLANKKLKSDIELERELERKRIAFFSAVSHELKTPITILKGHISGMLRGVGAYRDRDYYLLRSQETTEKMEEMVGELLTVSRMESNTFVTQIVDLAELLRMQLAELTELMELHGLELQVEIPEHLYAEVNSGMMEKVFRNLLMNAIRYTPEHAGEEIRIFLQETSERISCRIENTGVQIPLDALPHLFDAFYRVETSRNRRTGGSGLGLYIVRMALEQHDAGYRIENMEDGVRFSFEL